jgi:hypothetical protein
MTASRSFAIKKAAKWICRDVQLARALAHRSETRRRQPQHAPQILHGEIAAHESLQLVLNRDRAQAKSGIKSLPWRTWLEALPYQM